MSECRKEQITCPRCHYDSPMTVWNSINADLDPELKERFLKGELFDWKCEVCGLETKVPFGTLYHDMEHRFMLLFDPWDDNRSKFENEEIEIPNGFNLEGYTYRWVFGMNSLREKINILTDGLNDIAVERMKVFIRMNPENKIKDTDELLCYGVSTEKEAMERSGWERGAILFVRLREGQEPKVIPYPMEQYYDYQLAVKIDPRMEVKGVACVDNIWMNQQLHKLV